MKDTVTVLNEKQKGKRRKQVNQLITIDEQEVIRAYNKQLGWINECKQQTIKSAQVKRAIKDWDSKSVPQHLIDFKEQMDDKANKGEE